MKTKLSYMILAVILVALVLTGMLWSGDGKGEKEKIISVVQRFFDVLTSKDADEANKIVLPEGFSLSVREKNSEKVIRFRSFAGFAEQLGRTKQKYKEVMSNPKVLIHNEIASLWAAYKFYLDGKFSHDGVDAFSLVKTNEGWKIASIIYTVEKPK